MNEHIQDNFIDIEQEEESPAIRLFYELVMQGYHAGASDIHMDPQESELYVRIRINGVLRLHRRLNKSIYLALLTCAKIRSGMDIAEKRLPQDGHCRLKFAGIEINLRVSTIPTIYGEKMVLRYLNMERAVERADTFGMDPIHYQKMKTMLQRPGGIIYFTGPTGSGKSTTLYMILEYLSNEERNIMTIEDPVEKTVPGVNQSQVNRQAGLTFESGLRAILRQDPDVIMVGETRDDQTAKISMRAAAAGNLVLSTLHTRDCVGAISRIIEFGVEPYMVAENLNGVVSQRLVRKNNRSFNDEGNGERIAVHEVLIVDKIIRCMIRERRSPEEILDYAKTTQNMITLQERLSELSEEGVILLDEAKSQVEFS